MSSSTHRLAAWLRGDRVEQILVQRHYQVGFQKKNWGTRHTLEPCKRLLPSEELWIEECGTEHEVLHCVTPKRVATPIVSAVIDAMHAGNIAEDRWKAVIDGIRWDFGKLSARCSGIRQKGGTVHCTVSYGFCGLHQEHTRGAWHAEEGGNRQTMTEREIWKSFF